MISLASLQADLAAKLNAEPFFAPINVQLERNELYASEIALATVWQTPRGGRMGVGVIVAMPEINVEDPDSPGPELVCRQTLTVLEEPNINQNPATGTGIFAEDIGIYLIALLHQFALAQNITLYARGNVLTPNRKSAGVRGVDCRFEYRFTPAALNKTATVPISFADPNQDTFVVTMSCATPGAQIYYTTDGSFPGPAAGAAAIYQAAFRAQTGTQIRAAAYAPAVGAAATMVGSDVWTETVPG